MPCYDHRDADARNEEVANLQAKINELTEMLCFMCRLQWPLDLNETDRQLQLKCANWWKEHAQSGGHMKGPRYTLDELREAMEKLERK